MRVHLDDFRYRVGIPPKYIDQVLLPNSHTDYIGSFLQIQEPASTKMRFTKLRTPRSTVVIRLSQRYRVAGS